VVESGVSGLHDGVGMFEQLPLEQLLHPVHRLVAQPSAATAAKVLQVPVGAVAGTEPGQQQCVLLIDAAAAMAPRPISAETAVAG